MEGYLIGCLQILERSGICVWCSWNRLYGDVFGLDFAIQAVAFITRVRNIRFAGYERN